jgi:hypothetical protein
MTPIAAAVSPMKEAAVARSVEHAAQRIDEVLAGLEAVGMDVDQYAPRPKSFGPAYPGKEQYLKQQRRRQFVESITTAVPVPVSYPGAEKIRAKSDERVAAFLANIATAAGAEFDAYVAKLEGKVGECAAAEVRGYLWDGSVLTVTKSDGSVARWKTQMIVNCSVLGKLFNQWPTRKLA